MLLSLILLLTMILTVGLISLGGFVHNKGASLACPDWPLCFGKVLPVMEGLVAIEHSHRLLATLVGILCILLVFLSRKTKILKLSYLALGLVIFQGILGGLTVIYKLPPLISTLHLGTSMIFLACLLLMWRKLHPLKITADEASKKFTKILNLTTVFIFIQIVWGAFMRHLGAGSACGLGKEAMIKCLDLNDSASFWPTDPWGLFHMGHRYFALIVFLHIILTLRRSMKLTGPSSKLIKQFSLMQISTCLVQIILGMLVVYSAISPISTTLHLFLASVIWSTAILSRS